MKTYKITAEISVPYVNTYEVNAKTLKEAQRKIKREVNYPHDKHGGLNLKNNSPIHLAD